MVYAGLNRPQWMPCICILVLGIYLIAAVKLRFNLNALHALRHGMAPLMHMLPTLAPQMVISTSDINRVTVVPPGVGRLFVLQARDLIKYQVTTS